MLYRSYSKINLSLSIIGEREDGYHLLDMVFLPLELHDVLDIETNPCYLDSYITCDDLGLSNLKNNLVTKALNLMRETYGFKQNFKIHIHKEIPFAAGLGGGSSNAATAMMAIRDMLKLKVSNEELAKLGLKLGADVPFFFYNKPAHVEGIGEGINPIKVKKKYFALLVKPEEGCSTKQIYSISNECDKDKNIDNEKVINALREGDDKTISQYIGNDLMAPAIRLVPEIEKIVKSLKDDGFEIASMSGSGSTCFALSTDQHKCHLAMRKYEKLGYIVRLTKIMN